MKRWTVMLIPHDRGAGTRTLDLYAFHVWLVVAVFVVLSFSTAFLLQKYRTYAGQVEQLQQENAQLARAARAPEDGNTCSPDRLREIEESLRGEYDQRIVVLAEELSAVYELENVVREMEKLKPREQKAASFVSDEQGENEDGKGGPPGDPGDEVGEAISGMDMRAPHVIYGLFRPSADLIRLEIALRRESLQDLVGAMRDKAEHLAREPGRWPSTHPAARITSGYGMRKDPFTHRPAHHAGIDISAPMRSNVVATGRGKVIFAGREQYYGNVIRIDHGIGIVTVYAHLHSMQVKEGDTVERGDTIGLIGMTGRTTGPHVHYEVRLNGKTVDPVTYLKLKE